MMISTASAILLCYIAMSINAFQSTHRSSGLRMCSIITSLQAQQKPLDFVSMTVVQLREELRGRSLPVSGARQMLLDRLALHGAIVRTAEPKTDDSSSNIAKKNIKIEGASDINNSNNIDIPDRFIYITCKANVEKIVKNEIIDTYGFRFAFSRPGLLTFKVADSSGGRSSVDIDDIVTIFGACQGYSIASVGSNRFDEILFIAQTLQKKYSCDKIRLHVYARDEGGLKVGHPEYIEKVQRTTELITRGIMSTKGAADAFYSDGHVTKDGDMVVDVIYNPSDDNEKLFVGRRMFGGSSKKGRRVGLFKSYISKPGNIPDIPLPAEAPSRAYLKAEELWLWCEHWLPLAMLAGDTVLEVGSAPGGTAYSMLKRGMKVIGIDPCPLDRQHDPIIKNNENFTEIISYLEKMDRRNMPFGVNWLLCDANIPIVDALPYLQSMSATYGPSFKGVFLTCKLNDKILERPELAVDYLNKLKNTVKSSMGLSIAAFKYLDANRQEVLLCGLTKNTANLLNKDLRQEAAGQSIMTLTEQNRQKHLRRKNDFGERANEAMSKLQQFRSKLKEEKQGVRSEEREKESYHGQVVEGGDDAELAGSAAWHTGALKFRKHIDDAYRNGSRKDDVNDYVVINPKEREG